MFCASAKRNMSFVEYTCFIFELQTVKTYLIKLDYKTRFGITKKFVQASNFFVVNMYECVCTN